MARGKKLSHYLPVNAFVTSVRPQESEDLRRKSLYGLKGQENLNNIQNRHSAVHPKSQMWVGLLNIRVLAELKLNRVGN